MGQNIKYPRKRQGITAGVISLVLLDGFWMLFFLVGWPMYPVTEILLTLLLIIAIAGICTLFGYSIARNSKNGIVISSVILVLPIAYDVWAFRELIRSWD